MFAICAVSLPLLTSAPTPLSAAGARTRRRQVGQRAKGKVLTFDIYIYSVALTRVACSYLFASGRRGYGGREGRWWKGGEIEEGRRDGGREGR